MPNIELHNNMVYSKSYITRYSTFFHFKLDVWEMYLMLVYFMALSNHDDTNFLCQSLQSIEKRLVQIPQ